jgi:choline kinase
VTSGRERAIAKQRLLMLIFYIGVFLFVQSIFFVIYSTTTQNLIFLYKNIPPNLDTANKVMLLPNLQLASLFVDSPEGLIEMYTNELTPILTTPQQLVPLLFDFL